MADPRGFMTVPRQVADDALVTADVAPYVDSYVIEPGEVGRMEFYRAENAKWIGLAAGYAGLSPEHSTRLFEIPILITHSGFLKRHSSAEVENLQVQLYFGPTEINQVVSQ